MNKGDGGGPLNCPINGTNNFYVAGIVLGGVGCNNEYPAFYADISYYHKWIEDRIAAEGLTPPRPYNRNEKYDLRGNFRDQ
jgi:secreted trypsin-like serine protease